MKKFIFLTMAFLLISLVVAQSIKSDLNYDSLKKEVMLKQDSKEIMKLKLLNNTDECGSYCYSIFEIQNYQSFLMPSKMDDIFSLRFENKKDEVVGDDLIDWNLLIYNGTSKIIDGNGTYIGDEQTWIPWNWRGYYFKNKTIKVKLEAQRKINEDIDWIPTFFGQDMPWAWWTLADVGFRYGMNETPSTNTTFVDDQGNHNITASGTFDRTAGVTGLANDYAVNMTQARMGTNYNRTVTNSFTLEFWINSSKVVAGDYSVGAIVYTDGLYWASGGGWGFNIYQNEDNLSVSAVNVASYFEDNAFPHVIDGTWHHIALAVNSTGQWHYYVDGSLVKKTTSAFLLSQLPKRAGDIGSQRDPASPGYFVGSLDKFTFYTVYLNSSDIYELYTEGFSNPTTTLQSPLDGVSVTSKQVEFNCTTTSPANNIVNISLWGNWTGIWHRNLTFDASAFSNKTVYGNFKVNLTDYANYTWNCQGFDIMKYNSSASSNRTITIPDLTKPNTSILSPGASVSIATILLNFSVDDNVALSNCSYNITRGASLEKANKDLDITKKPYINATYLLSGEATYQINLKCVDTAGLINITNKTFIYSLGGGGGGSTGGGGGIVIVGGTKGWSMEASEGIGRYEITMIPETSRTQNVLFENLGDESRDITFGCEDITGEICQYVEFPQKTFTLNLLTDTKQIEKFTIILPEGMEKGDYQFNIIAVDDLSNRGALTVFLKVGGENFISLFFTKLVSSTTSGFPYLIIFFGLFIVSSIIGGVILARFKIPLKLIWIPLISVAISVTVVYLL